MQHDTTQAGSPQAANGNGRRSFREELRFRFDLTSDQASSEVVDQAIRAGVPFRGTNLWLLIFAIVIASVGLNVNSTAVIIGAMLISPLMGPIIGCGYGAAVADFKLVRLSLTNLFVATVVSLVASAAYFSLTPLSEAHSELLARTSPSIWDVLIALFGGLAGIVGLTRREKSNVVPGVAIATALMPPLCTAGYGLATANLYYFIGAFYLYFINSVFIAVATFVMVRVMRVPEVAHASPAAKRNAHRWIALLVAGTSLPSLLLAQQLVAAEVFGARSAAFLAAAFREDGPTIVVGRDVDHDARQIRVTVVGEQVTPERREALAAMLPAYGLTGTTLSIAQNETQTLDVAALREDMVRDLYRASLGDLQARDATIAQLREQVEASKEDVDTLRAIEREVAVQHPDATRVVVASLHTTDKPGLAVIIEGPERISVADQELLRAWLAVRAGVEDVWVTVVPTKGR